MRGAALAGALVIAVLVGAGAGYFAGVSNNTNIVPQSVPYTTIRAHVLGGGNISSVSGVKLTFVASSQTGYSSSPSTNPGGVAQVAKDNGHLQIVLREATFPNGSMAIVVTLMNIGRLNVSVGSSVLGGAENSGIRNNASSAERFDSYLVGCVNKSTVLSPVV